MRATHTTKVACLAIIAAILAVLAGAGPAGAAAADCQPFAKKPCLLPFPSNLFTKRDKSSVTGLRVHLPAGAMPVNSKGSRVGVAPYDRNDGFSPGSAIIVHIRGLDNARAFSRTGAATLANMGRSLRKRQPIVLIDERTGKRQLIWSELDANQTAAADINLLIHPGKNLAEGHTYVVVLRSLRTAGGKLIKAPAWFERLRDGRRLPRAERSQRGRYARIFAALKRPRIARSNVYEAWDFTVASRQNLTSRMLAIRNNAFAQLGDTNLADVRVQGNAPSYAVTSVTAPTPQIKEVQGSFQVPCYLTTCGLAATTGFHYSSRRPDATPTQISGNVATALFDCIVPDTASAARARADLSVRARPARQPHRGPRRQRRGHGGRAQRGVLRDRLVGPGRAGHRLRHHRAPGPQQLPERSRPAPARGTEHAVPRPPDAQPEGVCVQRRVPDRDRPACR